MSTDAPGAALNEWLRQHGGAIDEFDFDAQREFVDGFLRPFAERAWDEGSHATAYSGVTYTDNPYRA